MQLVKIRQRTKEWLEWRSEKVTASDAPIVMGVSPYKKIDKLWSEKIKCYESPPNIYMKRGNDLESIALQKFEAETGLIMFPMVAVHDDMNWMAASFDGVTLEHDAIVEIKCNGNKNHSLAQCGKVPDFHLAQIQHQIHVAGIEFAYYFSFDGEEGITLEVKRDQEFIDKMIEKEFEFWQCLQTLTPPTHTPKTKRRKNATAGAIS